MSKDDIIAVRRSSLAYRVLHFLWMAFRDNNDDLDLQELALRVWRYKGIFNRGEQLCGMLRTCLYFPWRRLRGLKLEVSCVGYAGLTPMNVFASLMQLTRS